MGKMMMVLVVGFGIVASFSVMQLNRSNLNAKDNASGTFEIVQARNLAAGGVKYAIMCLAVDSTWLTGYAPQTISNGKLSVTVQRSYSRYPNGPADAEIENGRLITAIGHMNGMAVKIQSVVDLKVTNNYPPGMGYAMMSEEDFTLSGNLLVRDNDNPAWNADIHTNSKLELIGTNTVTGIGTFTGVLDAGDGVADATFLPNVVTEEPSHHWAPPVDLPTIDPSLWKDLATRSFYSNTKLTGGAILGTKENPEIVYVEGDLELAGNVEGYGVFLVTGNLTLKGNTTVSALDPLGHNLGIIVGGGVRTLGTVEVTAAILSKGDFIGGGNVTVTGSIATEGKIDVVGDVQVNYHPIAEDLTGKIWKGLARRPLILSQFE